MRLYKKDVNVILNNIETLMYGDSRDPSLSVPTRLQNLFTDLYVKDLHPDGVQLLKDSYRLLQTKGCYFTDEE